VRRLRGEKRELSDIGSSSISEEGYTSRPTNPPMSRGLSQVLFNYLPERTFDYDRGACIGKVFELRLEEVKGIDVDRLCAAIQAYVNRWGSRVSDFDTRRQHLMLFGRPTRVLFNLFPLTFQCGYCDCVKAFEKEDAFVKGGGVGKCLHCGKADRFEQIYHILVHECGNMAGLQPRKCTNCHSQAHMALDLRGSQQARDFRWLCKKCGIGAGPVQRPCSYCKAGAQNSEEGSSKGGNMRVIPHRANNAYYPHNITVLNLPTQQTAVLRGHPKRDQILAAAVIEERYDLDVLLSAISGDGGEEVPEDIGGLLADLPPAEQLEVRRSLALLAQLRGKKSREASEAIGASAAALGEDGWLEVLEFVNVHTLKRVGLPDLRRQIEARHPGRGAVVERLSALAGEVGVSEIQLIEDFPVVTAVFGYTRVSYEPKSEVGGNPITTEFRGFNSLMTGPHEQKRRRPILVDDASTEALLFKLSPTKVVRWLVARGHKLPKEAQQNDQGARRWLLQNVTRVDTFVTLTPMTLAAQDVFVLVHTFAHLVVRALTRLSGIDRTGLAEYLFPRMAAFVVYNTKAGNNLGGLHTVYAEMQEQLLSTLREDVLLQTCVYDPLCSAEQGASCHACTHLPEMCCKHYNRGLSRAVLFNSPSSGKTTGFFST